MHYAIRLGLHATTPDRLTNFSTNFTFGEKFANSNELYNGYERTNQLWVTHTVCMGVCRSYQKLEVRCD